MKWSPEEEELLAKVWPVMGIYCARLFEKRSKKAIEGRAYTLGLYRDVPGKRTFGVCPHLLIEVAKAEVVEEPIEEESQDDEPLVLTKEDQRDQKSSYGFIPTGPVASVFHLGARNE